MNPSIRKVSAVLGVLMVALFLNLNFVQVVKGSSYRDAPDNSRVLLNEYASPRGQIIVGGSPVAESKATNDELKYLRVYPQGPLYAPVTGFYSITATPSPYLGTEGIEKYEDSVLSGGDSRLFGRRLADILTGRNPRGGNVELTIDAAAQQAAYNAMKDSKGNLRKGAVVAIDPSTGAILAAVSTPSYDPSKLSLHDPSKIDDYYTALTNDPADPLQNRAFNSLYFPGSIFKIVVSAAALKNGVTPDTQVLAPNGYIATTGASVKSCNGDVTNCVENFEGEQCENGKTASLAYALAKSCNTAFAALAVDQLHGQAIADEAKLFGFDPDSQLTIPMGVATSTIGPKSDLVDPGHLAHMAFGQQSVRVSPLEAAMMSAAVANDGTLMTPYLVDRELAPDLSTLSKTKRSEMSQVLSPTLDSELQQMMEGVVTSPEGTAHSAAISGVTVAGKTGTADTGATSASKIQPDAWFTGYAAKNGSAKIAVAVILENAGVNGNEITGGEAAAPVARAVMEAYLKAHP
ncbi:penicillin-binding protein 2 [Jatrophihabitans sp.]|uniref:peptidoglycan D,D-transpeptidase FtsI family protein n=1 Tax=Jatrophihabitans sp. TaxID=1932789 RepID=UPI0030C6ADD2|nr:pbpA [Jatrophihabitans sp.]